MIVVDSSVWIDNIRDTPTWQVRFLREIDNEDIVVGDVIVLEVLRGVRDEREAAVQERRFHAYGITSMLDPTIAIAAASNFRKLRAIGITIRSSVDLIIGTYCMMRDHQLLHDDRDFDALEHHFGLRVLR